MYYKHFLSVVAASMLLLNASCNKEEEHVYEITHNIHALNLVTPVLESQPSFISESIYDFSILFPTCLVTTNCNDLTFAGVSHKLSLPQTSFDILRYADGDYIHFKQPSGSFDGQPGVISNFNCKISGLFYRSEGVIPDVDNSRKYGPVVIAEYNVGALYSVATFTSDVTYRGITTTTFSYQGQEMAYKTKSGSYRVIINPQTLKADVVLYRVKFAEQAPALILVLKNLDVTIGRNGYTISGKDVIPGQQDGNMLTPNTSFPFEDFTLTTVSSDLTKINISYTVRNKTMEDKIGNGARVVYKGEFNGAYVNDPNEPFNPDSPIE